MTAIANATDVAAALLVEIPTRFSDPLVNPAAFKTVIETAAQALRAAVQNANVARAVAVGERRATVDMQIVATGDVRVDSACFRSNVRDRLSHARERTSVTLTMRAAATFITERLATLQYTGVKLDVFPNSRPSKNLAPEQISFEVRY